MGFGKRPIHKAHPLVLGIEPEGQPRLEAISVRDHVAIEGDVEFARAESFAKRNDKALTDLADALPYQWNGGKTAVPVFSKNQTKN